MTEDEAKTKWCWKLRNWETIGDVTDLGDARCIGSACMAWRVTININGDPVGGYCGIAGNGLTEVWKPE